MSVSPLDILSVAVGGALGGIGRFWLSGFVARWVGETFPWGTLAVNVSGAAAIGALAPLLWVPGRGEFADLSLWAALVTGVLGSYTTVSSFSLQTLALARNGEWGPALFNALASTILCLAAAAAAYGGVSWLLGT
jgi:CrcB protein